MSAFSKRNKDYFFFGVFCSSILVGEGKQARCCARMRSTVSLDGVIHPSRWIAPGTRLGGRGSVGSPRSLMELTVTFKKFLLSIEAKL